MSIKKIVILGKIPPPIGGVTVSVKNLIQSLEKKGIVAELLSGKNLFQRYDIAHIHYSNPLKRTLGTLIARVFSRKVIFTVHGKFLDCTNIFNRISIWLCDGIVVLNSNLYDQVLDRIGSTKIEVLPSLFAEGFKIESVVSPYFKSIPGKQTLLVYAYDRSFRDGFEVYGVDFIVNNLNVIPSNYLIVVLDLSGKYRYVAEINTDRIIYIEKQVNFLALLSQVDIYVRPTCMDGASIAVQEALVMGVPVIASDVVDRPIGTTIYSYNDISDFVEKLQLVKKPIVVAELQSVELYIKFLQRL